MAPSRPLTRAAVAVAVAVAGAALVLGGISTAHGGRVVAGAGLCLIAPVVGLPLVVGGLAGPLRRIGRPWGITARLGAENATRNQRRTAATVAALIVAVASIAAVATYATSWQAATSDTLTGSVHADLVVQHATAVGQESTFDPKVAADLRRVDGVRQVVEVRTGRARVLSAETAIDAVDPGAVGKVLGLRLRAGSLAGLRHATVLVCSAGQARRHAVSVGDTVTIELPRTDPRPLPHRGRVRQLAPARRLPAGPGHLRRRVCTAADIGCLPAHRTGHRPQRAGPAAAPRRDRRRIARPEALPEPRRPDRQ